MDSAGSVTITGVEDLLKKLENLKADVPKEFGKIARNAMRFQVEAAAKDKCPVDTGNLRKSIDTQSVDDYTVKTGTNVEYAPHVEYGTSRMTAQPFLRPAFDENKDAVVEEIRTELGKRVKEVGGV